MKLNMSQTDRAKSWLQTMGRYYAVAVIVPVIAKAEEIASERKATMLGKNHLEMALAAMTTDPPHSQ